MHLPSMTAECVIVTSPSITTTTANFQSKQNKRPYGGGDSCKHVALTDALWSADALLVMNGWRGT